MAISWLEGHHIGAPEPVDIREVRQTVDEVFLREIDGVLNTKRIPKCERFDGLHIWIRSERKVYRFEGGVDREHFVPVPCSLEVFATHAEMISKVPIPAKDAAAIVIADENNDNNTWLYVQKYTGQEKTSTWQPMVQLSGTSSIPAPPADGKSYDLRFFDGEMKWVETIKTNEWIVD